MHRTVLLNERIYDRERAEELVWKRARMPGVSRRDLLQFLAGGAAAALIPASCHPIRYWLPFRNPVGLVVAHAR
jgi:TAT (twin-arginine translocation) pathway signal sequence